MKKQITIGNKTYTRFAFGWIGPDLKEPSFGVKLLLAFRQYWPVGNFGFVVEYLLAYSFITAAPFLSYIYAEEIKAAMSIIYSTIGVK